MGAKMSQTEKFARSEARVLGGWARLQIQHARMNQLEADRWRDEYPERAPWSQEIWQAKADESRERVYEYARSAFRHAADALQARDAERLRRGLER